MKIDGFFRQLPDIDPEETQEWIDSLEAVVDFRGEARARFLVRALLSRARAMGVAYPPTVSTPYVNTIPAEEQAWFPGDEYLEKRIRRFIRWNAAVMVVKANKAVEGIGGHLSTFASSAAQYEVGFNHFFRGKAEGQPGDHVYIQGHAAPGIYARAFLERRLDEEHLDNFRRELAPKGLSSYPHPRLMPDFWEYPTVSMGLGPIASIYQARFNRYLHNRDLDDTSESRVWCFLGDGECDEPETLGSISLAAREQLDNLIWVVNCNLQRLDGPVRGNGKIIQELEAVFRGAGWNVIKVIWGWGWDGLVANDVDGVLVAKMNETVDGAYQRLKSLPGASIREEFFGPDPRLRRMVEHLTDRQLEKLPRGGHDYKKLYAAYKAATEQTGAPTVILAKTIKGWTLGPDIEGRNATHQIKKMSNEQFRRLRERINLEEDIPAELLEDGRDLPYCRFAKDAPEYQYMMDRRKALNGMLPFRTVRARRKIELPDHSIYDEFHAGTGAHEASTTMAFVRLLRGLARDEDFGERVVPIVPDEARTFGMDGLFRELKIYASGGQKYEPIDAALLLSYKESQDGQILEEGITEAGSMCSFIASGTSYADRGVMTVPFFTFYSMFGFQRVGDLIWQAADARARGFLMGGTAGRTTLAGEGLQHQDGHSLILASTNPAVVTYDPAFAYELAVIVEHGLHRMCIDQDDVIFYLTIYNENYAQPPMPDGVKEGIVNGMYRFAGVPEGVEHRATVLFSGPSHSAARWARKELAERYGVGAELWSVTSYGRLRDDAIAVERWNRLHPDRSPRTPLVTERLGAVDGPVVAVTDYMRAVPDQVSRWIPGPYTSLGTDGFGRSDAREDLRRFYEVNGPNVVVAVLSQLAGEGGVDPATVVEAIERYGVDPDAVEPWRADH
ncbi:MAG: pyruvate dehydrogenase (acetyl-transferring), homodimeric type [bacterium]|nr:pyruvate dehydrogenase (acetyl-transferring), homodimeric type [bacterium]MDE0352512.1 pyruvate dehydrogenase (acetyl-transferring), homodimeric type [bacterium]